MLHEHLDWQSVQIRALLLRLGLRPTYAGFLYTFHAISLTLQQPDRLLLVTKWLYPEIARLCNTNWRAVERSLRSVSAVVWSRQRSDLEQLAGYPLHRRPSASMFIAILSAALQKGQVA